MLGRVGRAIKLIVRESDLFILASWVCGVSAAILLALSLILQTPALALISLGFTLSVTLGVLGYMLWDLLELNDDIAWLKSKWEEAK